MNNQPGNKQLEVVSAISQAIKAQNLLALQNAVYSMVPQLIEELRTQLADLHIEPAWTEEKNVDYLSLRRGDYTLKLATTKEIPPTGEVSQNVIPIVQEAFKMTLPLKPQEALKALLVNN